MKKIVTIDSIMVSFVSAMGYGFGYVIPAAYGVHPILSLAVCFVVGGAAAAVAEKIIFSRSVQNSTSKRNIAFAVIALLFVVGYNFLARKFSHSLWEDLGTEMTSSVLIPVVSFFVALAVTAIKRKKLLEKYGTGESGFLIDEKSESRYKAKTGDNSELSDYRGKNPAVKTITGTYIGKADKSGVRFLGITYAKAPVGENRWKSPIPAEPSDKIFEAYYFGNSEIQPDSSHNILSRFKQGEDCLNLNIWTAKLEPEAKKPVVVYFHGGDGRYGGSAHPINYLDAIARSIPDAIFVSINYRFGVFGVVDFSSAADYDNIYNKTTALSLLDQIEALKWIKANIVVFGGDPENVTVMGDSAGGSCIMLLAGMDEAKGFFKRAFIMCASTNDTPENDKKASVVGKTLLQEFGAETVAELKKVTAEQLRDFGNRHYDLLELPPRDGKTVPANIEEKYMSGAASDIEFVFGIAADDLSGWQAMTFGDYSLDEMLEMYYKNLQEAIGEKRAAGCDALLQKYVQSGMSATDAKRTLLSDFQYKVSLLHDCRSLAKGGSKVRCFYWDVKGDIDKLKANSFSMVTCILGNCDIAEQMGYLNEQNITEIMQTFFGKFIHGNTMSLYNNELKGIKEIAWDEFTAERESVLHIQRDKIATAQNVFSENISELDKVMFG